MNVFQSKYPTEPKFSDEFINKGVFRKYVIKLRQLELQDMYVQITDTDHAEKLKRIIKNFDEIQYKESTRHTLFGNLKLYVVTFIDFWNSQIDAVLIAGDKHRNLSAKYEVIQILQETIEAQKVKQDEFRGSYLPLYNDAEAEMYDEVETEYDKYITNLEDILEYRIANIKYDNPDLTKKYIDELVTATQRKTSQIFNFTQDFIIDILVKCSPNIRNSLADIHNRMANNLLEANTDKGQYEKDLWSRLYEKNKEVASYMRQAKSSSTMAELQEGIERIRDKFENEGKLQLISHLEEEVKYWELKKEELEGITGLMTKLEEYEKYLYQQERIHKAVENSTHPGERRPCFDELGKKIERRKLDVKKYKEEANKMLITYFVVRGNNHTYFYDTIGKFYVDPYGHNTYVTDKGFDRIHFDCKGKLKTIKDSEVYYFDEHGRHLRKPDGERVYKRSSCSSEYKLAPNGLLVKTTKDCGHSFTARKNCKFEPPDPTVTVILPEAEPINIDSDYALTHDELKAKNEEALKFRDDVMNERKEKIQAARRLWHSKQMKRVKPEDTIDGLDWMAYNHYTAEHTLIDQICTTLYW